MSRFLLFISVFLLSTLTFGQKQDWVQMMDDPNANFYDIQKAFNEYWSQAPKGKGKGFKPYKRWEWMMEQRVFPTGKMPNQELIQQEIEKIKDLPQSNKSLMVDWTYFGNTSVPSAGGGAGRINGVRAVPGSTTTWFACAPAGGLWKTTNSGTSWTMWNTDFLSSIGATDVAIHPTNTNIMYLATGDGDASDTYSIGVLKSTDGGLTWAPTGLSWTVQQNRRINRLLINPNNPDILIAATSDGIYRTANAGVSWSQVQTGNFKDAAYKPGDPNIAYATQNGSGFFRSTNGGTSWTQVTTGLATSGVTRSAVAVTPANANYVYILMANSSNYGFQGVYRSTDSGLTFTQMSTTPNLLGWESNGSDAGGQGWYDLAIAVSETNANDVFVGGVNVWRSTNGGSTWTCAAHWYGAGGLPYVHADIHFLGFISGTSNLLVGCDGGVFHSTNGGSTFSDKSSNLAIAQQYRLGTAATNENRVITGWQDNGTNLKNTAAWSQVIGGDGMECAISQTNQNTMFGALYYGWILRSTNGGGSFSTIVNSGGTGIDSDGSWVTPYVISPNTSTTLYVGKDRVYKSVDNGTTWTPMGTFGAGNCNDLAVAKSNENYIYASKGGTLYKTTNGNTFSALSGLPGNFITDICVDPLNENRVWVTVSGYNSGQKVYVTTNGGTTWTNFSTGLPNIPANAIVYQNGSNDLMYVGTDAGVFYRNTNMTQWEVFGTSLPNTPISELEIHYASNRLVASTYGRGLWRIPVFTAPDLDASAVQIIAPDGTYCGTAISPVVRIGNNGTTTITSLTFTYGIVSGGSATYNWTGTLTSGNIVDIALPNADYGAGTFTYYVQITNVNGGGPDQNTVNDYVANQYIAINAQNTITLTLFTDCWGNEVSWELRNASNQIIFSGSGYGNQTTYNIPMCLDNGCYTFYIYDSYGDGLNGQAFGCAVNGNYFMTNNTTGTTIFTMAAPNYGTGTSHTFCLGVSGVLGCTDPAACNFNPAATTNDGSCTFPGCTNPAACNYSATAGCDNGSCVVAVANDVCVSAITLTVNGGLVAGSNASTCADGPNPNCGGASAIRDVWYKFVYTGGNITVSTTLGTMTDSRIAVFSACGGAQLACNDDIGGGNLASSITLTCPTLVNGQTYYIQAGGYNSLTGTFNIQVTSTPVNGCTDPAATNYNACASANDGSCTYNCSVVPPACVNTQSTAYTTVISTDPFCCNTAWDGICQNAYNALSNSCLGGCTNPTACNYNAAAGYDDGSCTFPGCTNPAACNYNASAGCDNGSCTLPGCNNPLACNYNSAAGCNDGSCIVPTYFESFADGNFTANPVWSGDTGAWQIVTSADAGTNASGSNTLRLNFGTNASGTQYLSTPYSAWQNEQEWSFWLGRRAQAYSATNSVAIWLYANQANLESGTISGYRILVGDGTGVQEYRLQRVVNGTATTILTTGGSANGITDHSNHVRVTRSYNGTWTFYTSTLATASGQGPSANACVSATINQGTASDNTVSISGSGFVGIVAVHGSGTNSRQAVEWDNLSIITNSVPTGCTNPTACNYNPGALIDNGTCTFPGCTNPAACNFNASAGCDNGTCFFPGCTNPAACNYNASAGCDNGSCTFPGCTNPAACNYNASAGCDNGTCTLPGCTDPGACNFDASAGCDNGSCEFTSCASGCLGDFDGNGVVSFSDLTILIGQFGCTSSCSADLNNDAQVNFADMSIFLTNYGVICP